MSFFRFATDVSKSRISSLFIKPAGEHTKVFITSYAANNGRKTFGGDAWRVLFRGTSVVAATVFDHGNGIYEAVTLLTTPGLYKLDIMLDYTQCKGMKDPPTEWFVKGDYIHVFILTDIWGFDDNTVEPQ